MLFGKFLYCFLLPLRSAEPDVIVCFGVVDVYKAYTKQVEAMTGIRKSTMIRAGRYQPEKTRVTRLVTLE